nr:MAG TPA: hypothetical protein [Microviridae sp.]
MKNMISRLFVFSKNYHPFPVVYIMLKTDC